MFSSEPGQRTPILDLALIARGRGAAHSRKWFSFSLFPKPTRFLCNEVSILLRVEEASSLIFQLHTASTSSSRVAGTILLNQATIPRRTYASSSSRSIAQVNRVLFNPGIQICQFHARRLGSAARYHATNFLRPSSSVVCGR
jgi:hypothetical protein